MMTDQKPRPIAQPWQIASQNCSMMHSATANNTNQQQSHQQTGLATLPARHCAPKDWPQVSTPMPLDAIPRICVTPHNRLCGQPIPPATPSGSRNTPRWFVAQTRPQAETWANANLRRQGYPTWLPLVPTRRRDRVIRTLWHMVSVPLWPGYVFVMLDQHDPWQPINCTYGVYRLVGNHGGPTPLQHGTLEAAMQAFNANETTPCNPWQRGAVCTIVNGPLNGMNAVVTEVEDDVAMVSVMMLGQLRNVAVHTNALALRT